MSRFEIKIVATLLLIAIIPLVTSVVLVSQVIRVSDSVSDGQLRRLAQPLARAADVYRALFEERKRGFKLQARLLAGDHRLREALESGDRQALSRRLSGLLGATAGLAALEVVDGQGRTVARQRRADLLATKAYRRLNLKQTIATLPAALETTFVTPVRPFEDLQALGRAERAARGISHLRGELASYYRMVFLIMFGAVLVVATGVGIFLARRTTRQVAVLARATREVAEGDLETKVHMRRRDELGELAEAFNDMVGQLRENRERIGYLEKIGAWQEIARRLAHEIKNPLTPIQLAIQQVHDKYDGEDERFRRLLDDASDIITEEVEGLRRLVQAFSSFARLPSVQPEPVDVNALLDDFFKSHSDLVTRAGVGPWQRLEPPIEVLVDRMLIKHVLFNLVENAAQAAEEAPAADPLQVTISAEPDRSRQRLVLTVSDNGPGMPADVVARVFDPYYTTKDEGTGLGLAIVKKIVLEHRGAITVRSTPGSGSRFSIHLPLVAPERHESAIRTTLSRLLKG